MNMRSSNDQAEIDSLREALNTAIRIGLVIERRHTIAIGLLGKALSMEDEKVEELIESHMAELPATRP